MPYINALADPRLPIAFIEYTWFEPMADGVGVKARHFFFFNYALNNPPPFSSLFQTTSSFSFFFKSLFSLFELSSLPFTLFFFVYVYLYVYLSVCVCVCALCAEREKKKKKWYTKN